MPSASSKSEKSASAEVVDPIKQAIVLVGHKIRNLEKRKSRLDSYKESIKTLTKEQIEAISKYDEVIQQLELSKEYVKQFMVISVENEKLRKKQAKKETQEKYLSEVSKIKQVLLIQNVLQSMQTDSVREDFLAGKNRAIHLTANDLKMLDDLYVEVSHKHNSENNGISTNDQFQKAAEYFMAIIEGKAKEVAGLTGAKFKELITSIQNCGYFDQAPSAEANSSPQPGENDAVGEEECFRDKWEILSNVVVPSQIPSEANLTPLQNSAPAQSVVPGPVLPGGQTSVVQNQQQIIAPNVPNIVPTPVSQVESNFFNAQGFKPLAPPSIAPPPNQNSRQINDVIQSVAGKFSFLQESEIDLSEINPTIPGVPGSTSTAATQIPGAPPSAIPTQTFTNQNFSGQPGGAPNFPSNYPPQPAAFQTFVPTFPAFVPPNASTVQNNTPNTNVSNPAVIPPANAPVSMPSSNSNNKPNNIPAPMGLASNRNPNINFNQGQQPVPNSYPSQPNAQNMSQPPGQHVYQHGNITVGSVENSSETVRKESEVKEKPEKEKQDWSQSESTSWADDCVDPSEWNSSNPNQPDGTSNENKFRTGRINRPGARVPRSANGYQGNRPRSNRQGGYRDSQNITGGGGGGTNNYYQNQNGYQSRNDRNNEFQIVGNKGNSNMRDGTFKERGDFSSRDREIRDNYGGGFKRGPSNRGPILKGSLDRSDKQGQTHRTNPGGPRGQRNLNRQPVGRDGSSFQRLQPNSVEKTTNK